MSHNVDLPFPGFSEKLKFESVNATGNGIPVLGRAHSRAVNERNCDLHQSEALISKECGSGSMIGRGSGRGARGRN